MPSQSPGIYHDQARGRVRATCAMCSVWVLFWLWSSLRNIAVGRLTLHSQHR